MKKVVTIVRFGLAERESIVEDSLMPLPLDSHSLPKNVTALRTLLLAREDEHAAELEAARNGLKDQAIQIEQLKARLAKLLRQRFGSSSEKMRGAIEQLELIIGDLEEEIAEKAPSEPEPEPEPSTADPDIQPRRRKPKRKPLPDHLPRDVVEHAPACACPKCGGALRRLGEDVTEVLEYVPGSFQSPGMCGRKCPPLLGAYPVPRRPVCRSTAASPGRVCWRTCWWGNSVTTFRCPPGRDLCSRRHRSGSFTLATGLVRARRCCAHWLTRLACT